MRESANLPLVVIYSQYRATVFCQRLRDIYEVKAVRLDASKAQSPVSTLSPTYINVLNPQIAIDPQYRVTVT